jgi:hypothetical protein
MHSQCVVRILVRIKQMKKTILAASVVVSLLLLFPGAITSAPANSQSPQVTLKPFLGKWRAMLSFVQAGGRFTVSLAEQTEVKQVDPNTIEFFIKPFADAQPVFKTTLTYDAATKKYLLSVATGSENILEKVALTYDDKTGFAGQGMLMGGESTNPIEVKIGLKPDGGHEWSVTDPKAPPDNNIVFSFKFLKRQD